MARNVLVLALLTWGAVGFAAAQQESNRIGVFDSTLVWQQTEEGKKMQAQLAAFRDGKLADINGKETELNKLKDKLRDQEMSLSDDKKSQILKDIDQKSIDLKRLNDDSTREMKAQFSEAQDQFQKELFQVVEALGKERKFLLVLEKTLTIYNDPSVDITPEVVTKFNQLYKGTPQTPASGKPKESKPPAEAKKPAPEPPKKPGDGGR
jgi:outer membrane protein